MFVGTEYGLAELPLTMLPVADPLEPFRPVYLYRIDVWNAMLWQS